MKVTDKSNVFERLRGGEVMSLELGCGPSKIDPRAIGVDMLDFYGVDLIGDIFEILAQFPDRSVSSIYTAHFLEHVSDLPKLLDEIGRILALSARLSIVVPHFSNPFYYSDPTHKTPFGLYTMAYFCKQTCFVRSVPQYGFSVPLILHSVNLGFKSYRPRYFRHALKRAFGAIFNSTMFLREFYEENLCWLVPCYEIRYELSKA